MSAVKHRVQKDCLNCGNQVEENYCTHCGQENLELKEKAWAMVIHAIADYFHFEHKFFGTIKPLLFKPGQLTKEYVEGKRARFIHPIRLYIFISIVFFLVVLSKKETTDVFDERDSKTEVSKKKAVKEEPKTLKVGTNAQEIVVLKSDDIDDWVLEKDTTYAAYRNRVNALPKEQRPSFIKKYIVKNLIKFKGPNAKKLFLENLLHNIPKMMFVLLPLFAILLHLVYIRKKKFYYEDLIYSFHLHSVVFLSILITKLLSWGIGLSNQLNTILTIYLIWYIYRSLRLFYNSKRWVTVFKMIVLFFAYTFLLSLCFVMLAAITAIIQ